jgi:cell division protein FtsB
MVGAFIYKDALNYICAYKMIKKILNIAKNKFLLTIIGLGVWLTFFDRNDIFTQYDLKQQVNKLEKERNYYLAEITANKVGIEELHTNQKSLEKFARETYLMKKDNEEVFVIVKK